MNGKERYFFEKLDSQKLKLKKSIEPGKRKTMKIQLILGRIVPSLTIFYSGKKKKVD